MEADSTQLATLTQKNGSNTQYEPKHSPSRGSVVDITDSRPTNDQKDRASESDTDDDNDLNDLPLSLPISAQRKRAQNARFEDFVREKDEKELRERSQEVNCSVETIDDIAPDDGFGARRIIDQVRDYQSELFARAKAGNIIAVLDTGSGKTLIAALLLRDIYTKEMDDRASGKSPRTSFFLVGHV